VAFFLLRTLISYRLLDKQAKWGAQLRLHRVRYEFMGRNPSC